MKFIPLRQFGDIGFGAAADTLISLKGKPKRTRVKRSGLTELDYGSIFYRFSQDSRLVEVTANAPTIELSAVLVPFSLLANYFREHDQLYFERCGFLVSPRFGIAHDPDFPSWVTAFPASSIDLWRGVGDGDAGA